MARATHYHSASPRLDPSLRVMQKKNIFKGIRTSHEKYHQLEGVTNTYVGLFICVITH